MGRRCKLSLTLRRKINSSNYNLIHLFIQLLSFLGYYTLNVGIRATSTKKDRIPILTELIFSGKHAHIHVYVVAVEKKDNKNQYHVINSTV